MYSNKTPNLDLPQWLSTDIPKMQDYNTAFQTIDTELAKALQQSGLASFMDKTQYTTVGKLNADGTVDTTNTGYICTDLLPYVETNIHIASGFMAANGVIAAFYDSSKELMTTEISEFGEAYIGKILYPPLLAKYIRVCTTSTTSFTSLATISRSTVNVIKNNPSYISTFWEGWNQDRFKFGIDTSLVPIPIQNDGQMSNKGTLMLGSKDTEAMRWGFHLLEGYAIDEKSRFTLLINKHTEEGKPLCEMYYYGTTYSHSDTSYNWLKIGSDVKEHSFLFGRDKAVSFGAHDFRNLVTLARINVTTDLNDTYDTIAQADYNYEPEEQSTENAKCVLYFALRDAEVGSTFYDLELDAPVMKRSDGWYNMMTWQKITYSFET